MSRFFIATLLIILLSINQSLSQVLLKHNLRGLFWDGRMSSLTSNDATKILFDQPINHFDVTDRRTWKQKIYVNDTDFDASRGVVLFLLGGEGPMSASVVGDHFSLGRWAKLTKALIVAVEHRMYGESNPVDNLNVEKSLKYLSTEQALQDFARARDFIVTKYGIQQNAKVIAIGGSYSGNLAAFQRMKFPHLFHGALAASAPVEARYDFFEYMNVVQNSVGSTCARAIRHATDEAEELIKTSSGRHQLESMFGTCKPIGEHDNDVATFFSSIADPACGVVQYNNDNNQYQPMNITSMCSMLVSGSGSPLQQYATFVRQYMKSTGGGCVLSQYSDYVSQLKDERTFSQGNMAAAGRAWYFQCCSEYSYWQPGEGRDRQPFSTKISMDWFVNQCKDLYGIDPSIVPGRVEITNRIFGGAYPQNMDRIMYTYGTVDPWHALQVRTDKANKFVMDGTAHCSILYPARDEDLPDLKKTRSEFEKQLLSWVQ